MCAEGETRCIWPQLCLPWWAAIRLDCVTPDCVTQAALPKTGLSAQGPRLPSTPPLSHDALKGAGTCRAASMGSVACSVQTRAGLGGGDRPRDLWQ